MIDWARESFLFASSIVYALLGGAMLLAAYKIFDWTTPHDLDHVIFTDGNIAAAITVGAFMIALALIIAHAIS